MLKRLALLAALLAAPAPALAATASYVVNLAGVNIANVSVNLSEDSSRYDIDLQATITGLGTLVANGTASIRSQGRMTGKALASETFELLTRAGGEDFRVDIGFAGGDVERFIVTPPLLNNIDRVALERKHLRGVNDMLAAFVLRGSGLDASLCNRRIKIFTGLERFDIEMRFVGDDTATSKRTGYNGPVVLCGIRYMPISGHFTTSDVTNYLAASDRIHIWYMPVPDTRTYIPYRVLIATTYGDLSMVLTSLDD